MGSGLRGIEPFLQISGGAFHGARRGSSCLGRVQRPGVSRTIPGSIFVMSNAHPLTLDREKFSAANLVVMIVQGA